MAGVTQWALSARRATSVQTGPSWSIGPTTGSPQLSVLWIGALQAATPPAFIYASVGGAGAATGSLTAPTVGVASMAMMI